MPVRARVAHAGSLACRQPTLVVLIRLPACRSRHHVPARLDEHRGEAREDDLRALWVGVELLLPVRRATRQELAGTNRLVDECVAHGDVRTSESWSWLRGPPSVVVPARRLHVCSRSPSSSVAQVLVAGVVHRFVRAVGHVLAIGCNPATRTSPTVRAPDSGSSCAACAPRWRSPVGRLWACLTHASPSADAYPITRRPFDPGPQIVRLLSDPLCLGQLSPEVGNPSLRDAGTIASAALAGGESPPRPCGAPRSRRQRRGPHLPVGRGPPLAARLGPGVGETRRRARADCSLPGMRSACSRSCRRGYGTQAEHLTSLQGRGRLRNLNEHGAFAATARHRLSLIRKRSQVRVLDRPYRVWAKGCE
jgi:hypothetical protein